MPKINSPEIIETPEDFDELKMRGMLKWVDGWFVDHDNNHPFHQAIKKFFYEENHIKKALLTKYEIEQRREVWHEMTVPGSENRRRDDDMAIALLDIQA